MVHLLRKIWSVVNVALLLAVMSFSALTPTAFANDSITSVFLILDNGGPITTAQDLRFSLWSDGRYEAGDVDGLGAINIAAAKYAGYQTVITRTPDSNGRLKVSFAALSGLPTITEQNQFLMIEYKEDADPDTSYVIYDDTYLGTAMSRFPLIVNGPDIYQGIYTNDATEANTFTLDRNNTGGDVTLQFGKTLNESLKWNDAQDYFEFSDAVVVGGNFNVNGNITRLDADNTGADANVDIVAEQGVDADGTLRYNATLDRWEISNDGGSFQQIATGTGGADDFESTYAADVDKVLTTGNGILTFNTGTNDFIVDSNDWNVTAAGALDAASVTSNGALTAAGTTSLNGVANIGDGGDDVAINSNDWDVSSAGVGSGFTGFTSTGFVNFSGTAGFRIREVADEAAATCTTIKEVVLDTTENKIYICTVVGAPGTWVAAAGDADTLDTLDSTEFIRSNTSDNFTSGTLTLDGGTTLTINGTANIGDGGDDIAINSNDWDISSAGVVSGLTGITSTGSVDLNGASALRLRESANPTTSAACATVNEIIINTTLNRIEICTVTGGAGAATWITASGGDATTLDGVDSTEFLRSNTSDNFTSGTLTTDSGTTFTVNGTANIGDGGDNVAINSDDWDISSAGVASGLTGVTSSGSINFSGASGQRMRESANPTTSAACTTASEIIMNTTLNRIEICTVPGGAGAATWVVAPAGSATDLSGITATQFLRSDTSDNFTSGTLTTDSGTTFTVNGTANIGDGGDNVAINSDDWDISSAGVASGLTGLTSTGSVNFSGSLQFRIREDADPDTNADCGSIGELIFNTTTNQLMRCTTTGTPGTWTNVDTTGGTPDFEAVYTNDADKVLTTSNGNFTVNSGTGDTIIDSNDWNVTAAGALDAASITSNGALTASGTTNLNGTANFNGATNVGDGGDNVAINSNVWDISAAGVASGFTGIASTGVINFTGASSFRVQEGSADPGTCTVGQIFFNTTSNSLKLCTSTNTWTIVGSANGADLLDGLDSGDFLRSNASDNFTTGTLTFDAGTTLLTNGTLTVNGASTIGDGGDSISVNSNTWDISSAGAASGFTTYSGSGNITTTGGDVVIGTTGLSETTSATDSGAFKIGAFDEFTNSNGTNVQDVLDDLDALVGSNAANNDSIFFYPEYPGVTIFPDGIANEGTLSVERESARHFYQWTSNKASTQDMDVRVRIVLPTDFVSTGDLSFEYLTGTNTAADNAVDVAVINVTDSLTTCATSVNNTSTTWLVGTITAASIESGCTGGSALNAGDVIEVVFTLYDNSGAPDFSRIGFLRLDYAN